MGLFSDRNTFIFPEYGSFQRKKVALPHETGFFKTRQG